MTMSTNQVSVSTTAVSLINANTNRKTLMITNNGDDTTFIGPSGVTASTGFPLTTGKSFKDDVSTAAYYAICDTGESAIVELIEEDN